MLQHGPQLPAHTVAYDGGTERATQGVRHTRRCDGAWRIENVGAPQHSGPSAPPLGGDARKRAALSDAPDQAESLWRPLARRDFKMSRPARVLIRWRKPCFLARRRLLGWNVRFTQLSSSHPTVAVQQVESCRWRAALHQPRQWPSDKTRAARGIAATGLSGRSGRYECRRAPASVPNSVL